MRPLVIVNLCARKIAGDPALVTALRRLPANVVTTATLAQLDEVVTAERADRVVLVGGDGTHMAALSCLSARGPLPEIALVAAGTVGTAARALGSKGRVVDEVTRSLTSRDTIPQSTLEIGLDEGRMQVGFTFGAGLVSSFFEHYEATERGVAAAARLALRIAVGAPVGSRLAKQVLSTVPAHVEADGQPVAGDRFSLIVVSVLRDVGLGLRVTYRAGERPDRVHAIASSASPAALALASPNTLLGRTLGDAVALDALVAALVVSFPSPTRIVVDGDTFSTSRARITPGPAFKLVVSSR